MQFLAAAALFTAVLAAPTPQMTNPGIYAPIVGNPPAQPHCPNPGQCNAPSDQNENVDVTDFFLRKDNSGLKSVTFKISGQNVKDAVCSWTGSPLTIPQQPIACGSADAGYRGALIAPLPGSNGDFDIAVYHKSGDGPEKWNSGSIPKSCHAGSEGADEMVCDEVGKVTIALTSNHA